AGPAPAGAERLEGLAVAHRRDQYDRRGARGTGRPGAGGRGSAHLPGTMPAVRFIPLPVVTPARSDARKAAALPTSASEVRRPSTVPRSIHAISSSRVMPPVPVP